MRSAASVRLSSELSVSPFRPMTATDHQICAHLASRLKTNRNLRLGNGRFRTVAQAWPAAPPQCGFEPIPLKNSSLDRVASD